MDVSFMVWIGGLIVRKWLDGSKEIGMNGCRICVVDRENVVVRVCWIGSFMCSLL